MKNKVLKFISNFQTPETKTVFLCGMCYWFAVILSKRFGGAIVYHPVNNHFACKIDNSIYDITGELEVSGFELWEYHDISGHRKNIIQNCILKDNES